MGGILLAVCSLGLIRIEHEAAMLSMRFPLARKCRMMAVTDVRSVSLARNMAAQVAETEGLEYLIFWDDDIIPRSATAVRRMVDILDQNEVADVLGGVYPVRSDTPEPIVIKEQGNGVWWGWQDGGVHKVRMTGTGFTAIRVSSLARLPAEQGDEWGNDLRVYFREEDRPGGMTDDFFFADLCERGGLNWYVDGGLVCDQIDRQTGALYSVEKALVNVG